MNWNDFLQKESSAKSGETLAAEIISAYNTERHKNLVKLAELEGEVVAHSMVSALHRFKTAAAKGYCWECGTNAPSMKSSYGRCTNCEANDE